MAGQQELVLKVAGAASKGGMGWMEFISSIVSSIAWPLAAVAIAAIFHKQIAALLSRIKGMSWGETKIDFSTKLDKIEEQSQSLPAQPFQPPPTPANDRFSQLLAIAPNAALLDAWGRIETAVLELAKYRIIPVEGKPFIQVIEMLRASGVLDVQLVTLLHEMRVLRNAAAHDEGITITDALRFQEMAQKVETSLISLRFPPP